MKIAFVSGNREQLPDPVVPLGVLYIMAATPERHEKELWDLCFEDEPLEYLRKQIRCFQPEVVAIGMRNIHNSDYTGISSALSYYRALIQVVREEGQATVILGGGGFSVMPRELMVELRPDFGISGEGEVALVHLLDAIENGNSQQLGKDALKRNSLSRIGNLHFFRDGELISNPARDFNDINQLAMPARQAVDPRYYQQVGIENVQTKRGCALRCDYCTYPIIEGRAVRKRDPEAVVDEMMMRVDDNPSISHFFIVDSVFNIPPKHAKDICRVMIKRGFKTPWTCYANPIGFDAELADLMSEATCAGMEIGSDSGCDEILDKLRKGFSTKQIQAISQISKAHALPDCHTFLLGTPGETLDHVKRTLDFIVELNPFAAILMAYKDDYEALDRNYAKERQALRAKVLDLLESARSAFPRWIIPALSVHFDSRLFRALRKRSLHGPLWQHIHHIPTASTTKPGLSPASKQQAPAPL